ncbi:hypothetical protein BDZ91DRAFT_748420 [Kalaharituber pfeilii]|nr:hypothetical protein BDZ91DRAFT_748420 [Kalaharituber pfeilii]
MCNQYIRYSQRRKCTCVHKYAGWHTASLVSLLYLYVHILSCTISSNYPSCAVASSASGACGPCCTAALAVCLWSDV